MKLKINGVSIWIWGLGLLVTIGVVVSMATLSPDSKAAVKKNGNIERISRRASSIREEEISEPKQLVFSDAKARAYFETARRIIQKKYDVDLAEKKLVRSITAGEASILTIKYQDEKRELDSLLAAFEVQGKDLIDYEIKVGYQRYMSKIHSYKLEGDQVCFNLSQSDARRQLNVSLDEIVSNQYDKNHYENKGIKNEKAFYDRFVELAYNTKFEDVVK